MNNKFSLAKRWKVTILAMLVVVTLFLGGSIITDFVDTYELQQEQSDSMSTDVSPEDTALYRKGSNTKDIRSAVDPLTSNVKEYGIRDVSTILMVVFIGIVVSVAWVRHTVEHRGDMW